MNHVVPELTTMLNKTPWDKLLIVRVSHCEGEGGGEVQGFLFFLFRVYRADNREFLLA